MFPTSERTLVEAGRCRGVILAGLEGFEEEEGGGVAGRRGDAFLPAYRTHSYYA